ncbi:phage tail protein [Serratia symbiotica]|uniref:Phage tail protein n=1 Tax=Serratia symbiotica TaxID=138074 RepID=A0A068Z6W7_9GAMM|nr:phage tail protein [Serratia symbiotica]QLH61668.1 phage tail protein [Serratia symbiotica]QLH63312.1 phage tail protein [Serratia symbiotica]CDS56884.1 Phage-related tail fiber protein-like protein [Serratia symbiotica]
MATKYYALLTNIGAAKLANATALGAKVEITHMAVGDGNGVLPTPNPAQIALTHEVHRAQLNMLTIDPVNTNQIIAEQVIPEDVGGWWIREIGLFDKDGDMIAVANCAETYKPQLQEGSGRVQVIRVILIVSSTEAVTLRIDPSVVLATRKYVDDAVIEVKAYADSVMKKHTDAGNPHSQYLQIENALSEINDAGLIVDVLKNLGLTEKFSGRFIGQQIFTTPGAINYKPTPGTKRIKIILTGGGGRGYGYLGWGSGLTSRGAGGGAGGTVIAWLNVDETKTYPGVVGRGSDETLSATSSTFNGLLTAGNGVNTSSGDAGGAGGTAIGGDLNIQGGDGSDAPGLISTSANPYRGGSGDGGVSYWGGGKRSGDDNLSGKGKTFGAGGGGNTRTDPFIGNYGSDGVIFIEEFS